jgi:hypothetical protein
MDWLPEFALDWSDQQSIGIHNMVEMMRRAALTVYTSEKYQKRGEFGELLLHAVVRQEFNSSPAISKIYFKTATNDTVKGFDAVHVVGKPGKLELWLGEVKFYEDIKLAIRDVSKELKDHTGADYLRQEFALITSKLDQDWPHREEIQKLLHPNTSLDSVFKQVCIPVLLTYDSDCISAHSVCSAPFVEQFKNEILSHHKSFAAKSPVLPVKVCLFLVPLHSKKNLVEAMHRRLKSWQQG